MHFSFLNLLSKISPFSKSEMYIPLISKVFSIKFIFLSKELYFENDIEFVQESIYFPCLFFIVIAKASILLFLSIAFSKNISDSPKSKFELIFFHVPINKLLDKD